MMEDWICRQNIQRWRSQLATTNDERQREILTILLAEEQEKLDRFISQAEKDDGGDAAVDLHS
jgi:hypothetical protein